MLSDQLTQTTTQSSSNISGLSFSITVFGSTSKTLANRKLDENSIEAAKRFLEEIQKEFPNSMGGSELLSTLKKLEKSNGSHFLLITDGSVSDRSETLKKIAKELKSHRFSTLGIGYAINSLVRSIARAGSGFFESLIPGTLFSNQW